MSAAKKPTNEVAQAIMSNVGVLELPYSCAVVHQGEELDHAVMRARQLVDLLNVIGGEGPSNLMWLAQQLAGEVAGTIKLICSQGPSKGGFQ